MSTSSGPTEADRAKTDQLIHHFYAKTVAVISQARTGEPLQSTEATGPTADSADRRTISGATKTRRINKWFNLEIPEPAEPFRSQIKQWRTVSSTYLDPAAPAAPARPPSLVFEVVLDPSDLTPNQVVVLSDQRGRRVRVTPPPPPAGGHPISHPNPLIARPASAAGYTTNPSSAGGIKRAISPYPPGPGIARTNRPSGTTSTGSRSPSKGATGSQLPIVLERWTLDLIPYAESAPPGEERRHPSGSAPRSGGPSPTSSSSTDSYSLPSGPTAPPPPSSGRPPSRPADPSTLELPTVYKRSILHFRNLYSLVRMLPSSALAKTLARRRRGLTTLGTSTTVGDFPAAAGGRLASSGELRGGVAAGGPGRSGAGLKVGLKLRAVAGSADSDERGDCDENEAIDVDVPLANEAADLVEDMSRCSEAKPVDERPSPVAADISFPGVATPFGILILSLRYRTNVDFAVEDIETLLSSRFIDEDFFRPTIARYASNATLARDPPLHDDVVRPGSLPISAAFRPRDAGREPGETEVMASSPEAGRRGVTSAAASPPHPNEPMRKSYGDLAARSQPGSIPTESPRAETPLMAPVPVPGSLSRPPPFAASSASSSRYGSAGAGGAGPLSDAAVAGTPSSATRAGGDPVEPAFISLSRARRTSFGGSATSGSGIQRASPISRSPSALDTGGPVGTFPSAPTAMPSSIPTTGSLPRRTSLTSSGASGSPIFRPGSYISSSPSQGHGYGHAYSYSGSGAGIIRQHPISGSPSSQQSFGVSRSPLAGPPTFPGGASGPAAAPRPIAASVRAPSYSGPGVAYGSQGSYTASRSYGRAGSSGGSAEWAAGAAGPGGPESLSRRSTASRLSFGAAGSPAVGAYASGRTSRLGTMMRQHDEGRFPLSQPSSSAPASTTTKRFLNEGKAPDDAAEIEDFLSMLDSKPDLRALDSSRSFPTSSSTAPGMGARSVVVSKRDIDEQLRLLKSSVFGSISGPSGESPSPPAFTTGTAGAVGMSASPRGPSGLSALRRQTSRLSIEEHPAEELAAEAAAGDSKTGEDVLPAPLRLSPPQQALAPHDTVGSGLDRTPRGGYRSLKRDVLVSPTLSATSSSTALPPPPLSGESPLHLEPRYLPLPHSSATSPLASPRNTQQYGAFPCAVPPAGQPYPPLPYPPSSSIAHESTSTGPISLGPYSSHASRQPIGPPRVGGGTAAAAGGFGLSTIDSERTSMAASVSSLSTRGDGDGEQDGENSYRGEEEAVGRLELDDSPALSLDANAQAHDSHEHDYDSEGHRGRSHWTGLAPASSRGSAAVADDNDEMATLAAAAYRHSRDPTPAARQPPSPGYFTSNPRRSRSRGAPHGMSPPDMPWMA